MKIKSHYIRRPSENVDEGISRPVEVKALNAELQFVRDGKQYICTFEDELDERASSDRLNTFLEPTLSEAMETLVLPIKGDPSATGMGNPHCTFFVPDIAAINLEADAAPIEHHPLFPERTNVQFAQVIGKDQIRMRVWERGVGVTLASGSSSCATAVAAARRGLTGRSVKIDVDGGSLQVDWREDGVWLTGPTMHVFSGHLTTQFLDSLR